MEPEEGYVTVREAAQRIGYSTRQVDRFIRRGKLEAVHYSASLRKVSVASIDAFNSERGHRPIDPLAQIKELLHAQEQVIGDSLRQLAMLRQQEIETTPLSSGDAQIWRDRYVCSGVSFSRNRRCADSLSNSWSPSQPGGVRKTLRHFSGVLLWDL